MLIHHSTQEIMQKRLVMHLEGSFCFLTSVSKGHENIKLTKLQCEIWENGDIAATKCDEAGNMRSQ